MVLKETKVQRVNVESVVDLAHRVLMVKMVALACQVHKVHLVDQVNEVYQVLKVLMVSRAIAVPLDRRVSQGIPDYVVLRVVKEFVVAKASKVSLVLAAQLDHLA